jgi:hypothetical protein
MFFVDKLDLNTSLTIKGEEDINWPAWVEKNKRGRLG